MSIGDSILVNYNKDEIEKISNRTAYDQKEHIMRLIFYRKTKIIMIILKLHGSKR